MRLFARRRRAIGRVLQQDSDLAEGFVDPVESREPLVLGCCRRGCRKEGLEGGNLRGERAPSMRPEHDRRLGDAVAAQAYAIEHSIEGARIESWLVDQLQEACACGEQVACEIAAVDR
jgi:hypothetical protein